MVIVTDHGVVDSLVVLESKEHQILALVLPEVGGMHRNPHFVTLPQHPQKGSSAKMRMSVALAA